MQNLLADLEAVLKKEKKFVSDDGRLFKNRIIEAALKLDASLIALLLSDKTIKEKFFKQVGKALVFDKVEFQRFISNKQFLADSYTSFKNKIGLSDGEGGYLKESNKVVLNWAYKDCVLEGGMTKEESSRNEIFYNTTLAPDEITRLFSPKVFTGFEKWDADAITKGKPKKVKEIKDTDNLLIKSNNLLALHCLKERYAGKVKLIYIDPPFNTDNDSFKYNDSFNHSTWLTFMKNRLEIAKHLLRSDGVILVHCDDNEQGYLKVLMDEVFNNNFLNTISVMAKVSAGASGGGEDKKIKKNIEYIHCYYKDAFYGFKDAYKETKIENYIDMMNSTNKSFKYTQVLLSTGKKERMKVIKDGAGEDIIIYKHANVITSTVSKIQKNEGLSINDLYKKYFNKIYTTTNSQSSIRQRIWDAVGDGNDFYSIEYTPKSGKDKGKLITQYYTGNKKVLLIWFSNTAYIDKKGKVIKKEKYGTFWDGIDYNNLNKEGGVIFSSGKKPEQLPHRIIEMGTEPEDLVLDFFSGSGTTLSIAHKMGRQWIGVEQMDYIKDLPESRLKNVIRGDQTGVSKSVGWQGGGEFIYCELKEWNEKYIQNIRKAKTKADIKKIYRAIQKEAFYRYDVDMSQYQNKEFEDLSLANQKKSLCDCLDANHLYVNYSERDDSQYKLSAEEKDLTKKFYGK